MGWNLSCLSAITRVPQNVYFDGQVRPVQLNADDRFALDGQRLVLKNGTYSSTGSEYGTEVENFATVTLKDVPSTSLKWFEVVTKDGVKMEYGKTADSRFLNEASSTVVFWALNRVIYPDGNYIDYQYTASGREEPRLFKILYTGNLVTTDVPYNEIQFDYKVRQGSFFSDIRTIFIGGSEVQSRHLLDKITVKAAGTTVKDYQLIYGHDDTNSYLKEVREGDGGEVGLNPTVFKYGDQPVTRAFTNTVVPSGSGIQSFSGDFNGDGKYDVLSATFEENKNGINYYSEFKSYLKDGTTGGFTLSATQTLPSNYTIIDKIQIPNQYSLITGDFTGDGNDDVVALNISYTGSQSKLDNVRIYESKNGGTSFSAITRTVQPNYNLIHSSNKFFYPGDFNGDGISEYIAILGNSLGNYDVFLCEDFTSTGACGSISIPGATSFPPSSWVNANRILVLDFNGDGKHDIMLIGSSVTEIFTFEGSVATRIYSGSFPSSGMDLQLGDFNGDGKTDIIQGNEDFSSVIKGVSTGTNFSQSSLTLTNHLPMWTDAPAAGYYKNEIIVGDFNGDGKSDLYYEWNRKITSPIEEGNQIHYFVGNDVFYSTGNDFSYKELYFFDLIATVHSRDTPPPVSVGLTPIDINGDGKTDLVSSSGDYMGMWLFHANGKENLLHKVANGLKKVTEWNYKSLVEGTNFYTKGTQPVAFPVNTIQPASIMVQEIKTDNGIGGSATKAFSYEGATFHRSGKGLLGFTKVTSHDLSLGMKSVEESELNSAYYILAPKSSATFLSDNSPIGSNTMSYVLENAGPKRFWVKTDSVSTKDELSGVTTTTRLSYDAYANLTQQTVTIPGIHTSVTDTEYGAYPSGIPNKPTLVTVTQARSDETPFQTKTRLDYNGAGQLTSKIDFYQQDKAVTTTFSYNNFGNQTSTTVSASGIIPRSTGAVYDSLGRYPVQTTNQLTQQSSASYDPKWGSPLTVTGVDGRTTSYQYDSWGRLIKTTFPEGYDSDVTLHWDINGQQRFYRQAETEGQPTVKTWYDQSGREIRTETQGFGSSQWSIQTQSYDAKGNVHIAAEPHFSWETYNTVTHSYDDYNRIGSVQHSAFGTTTHTYSYSGGKLTVTATSPTGTTSQTTDAAGMLTAATDNGGTLNYTYYSHGGLKTVSNGSVNLTTNEYDAYGRQTKLTDLNAGVTEYSYDALGQLTWQKTAKGDETALEYNLLGQVTTRTGVEGITTYTYGTTNGSGEIKNRIKTVSGFAGTSTSYSYNLLGQLTQLTENNNGSHTTGYTYNDIGDISTVSYPSGLVIANTYNARGYLDEIKHGGTVIYKTSTTNGLGQVTEYKRANGGITSNISYANGFPTAYTTTGIQDYQLVWDYQKGTLTSRKDARTTINKTETFTYDNLQRLTGANVSGGTSISTAYAPGGNITSKTDAGAYSYHSTKIHAVTSVTNPAPAPIPTLQQDITYTPFMQAETVEENGYLLTYSYGTDYNRVKSELKQGGSTLNTRYYFEAGFEKDITGTTTRYIQYISSPAGLAAILESEGSNHTIHYTCTDHLGSILTVTDENGTIEAEQSFDAWGRRRNVVSWELLPPTAATSLPVWLYRGYTGHEHLDQFGLINMNGRMYDPVLGRMLSPDNYVVDPLFSQDYNRYTYARNNPLVYTDPDGEWVHLAIGAVLGGISGWQIGKSQGAKGWEMAGYILAGAGIGVVSAGLAETIASSMLATSSTLGASIGAYATAGAVSGAFSGTAFTMFAGGNIGKGALMGGLMGGAAGALGGYLQYLQIGREMKRSVADRRFWMAFNDIGDDELKKIAEGTVLLDYVRIHPYLPSGAIQPNYFFEELIIGGKLLKGVANLSNSLWQTGRGMWAARRLRQMEFGELQALTKTYSTELNTFFKSGGSEMASREALQAYKELATRILNGTGGTPATKLTETALKVQSQRLEMINRALEILR